MLTSCGSPAFKVPVLGVSPTRAASLPSLSGGPCVQLALSLSACALTRRHMGTWGLCTDPLSPLMGSEAVFIGGQCFSYLLLHNKPAQNLVV